jgi:peptidoglycan/LPS O-acetylase OafA/YrhL
MLLSEQMIRGYLGLTFGCVAALWNARGPVIRGGQAYELFWLLIMTIGYTLLSVFSFVSGNLLISFGSSWLIVALLHQPTGSLARLLSAAPLVWAGRLTYGVYLFHVERLSSI